ncbi:hypothetical protein B0H11DRAFT_2217662 [Mycena galericulata]|nr:hypothetical protein B0H11DRAFT_2217662 [Mycena galericulata]
MAGGTGYVEPPAYNPYAAENKGGSVSPGYSAQIGRTAFSTGTTSSGTTSSGTTSSGTTSSGTTASGTTASGTSNGGTSGGSIPQPAPRSNVRGLSGSPIASGTTSPGGTPAPSVGFISQPSVSAPYQQQESPTALFGSQGFRQDAFFHISREIFVTLDRSVQPVGTQMIEASKMRRFRELCGNAIPPYYESHVLPMYYKTVGAQCVGSNVLSWDGWNTFLAHKILSGPDAMYGQLGAALRGLNIQLPWPLVRTDFPAYAYPDASAREAQFQQGIRDLAGAAMGGGGRHSYHAGGGHGASGVAMGIARKSLMSGLLGGNLFN